MAERNNGDLGDCDRDGPRSLTDLDVEASERKARRAQDDDDGGGASAGPSRDARSSPKSQAESHEQEANEVGDSAYMSGVSVSGEESQPNTIIDTSSSSEDEDESHGPSNVVHKRVLYFVKLGLEDPLVIKKSNQEQASKGTPTPQQSIPKPGKSFKHWVRFRGVEERPPKNHEESCKRAEHVPGIGGNSPSCEADKTRQAKSASAKNGRKTRRRGKRSRRRNSSCFCPVEYGDSRFSVPDSEGSQLSDPETAATHPSTIVTFLPEYQERSIQSEPEDDDDDDDVSEDTEDTQDEECLDLIHDVERDAADDDGEHNGANNDVERDGADN